MNLASHAVGLFFVVVLLTLFVAVPLQTWHSHYGLLASATVTILLPAVLVAGWLMRDPQRPQPWLSPRSGLGPLGLVWVCVVSALLGLAANAVTSVLAETSPALQQISKAYEAMFFALMYPDAPHLRIVAIVAIVIAAPLCEEMLFRGVILPMQATSKRRTGSLIAANGLMFGLLHLNPLNLLALTAIGAFFAHVSVATRSVWPSVLGHATLNLVNGVVVPEVLRAQGTQYEPSMAVFATSAAVMTPIAIGAWVFGARKILTPVSQLPQN